MPSGQVGHGSFHRDSVLNKGSHRGRRVGMPSGRVGQAVVHRDSCSTRRLGMTVGMPPGQVGRIEISLLNKAVGDALSACHQAKWARPRVAPSRRPVGMPSGQSGPWVVPPRFPAQQRQSSRSGLSACHQAVGQVVVHRDSLLNKAARDGPVGCHQAKWAESRFPSSTRQLGMPCRHAIRPSGLDRESLRNNSTITVGLSACHQAKWATGRPTVIPCSTKAVIAVGVSACHLIRVDQAVVHRDSLLNKGAHRGRRVGMPSGRVDQAESPGFPRGSQN